MHGVRAVHKKWLVAAPLVTNNNGEQQPMCQRMETSSSANEACTYTRASCTNTHLYRSRGHGSHVLWIMSIWLRLRLLYISYMGCRLLCILHLLLNGLLHVLDRLLHLHCMRVCLPSCTFSSAQKLFLLFVFLLFLSCTNLFVLGQNEATRNTRLLSFCGDVVFGCEPLLGSHIIVRIT